MSAEHSISIAVLSERQEDVELINATFRTAGHAARCLWVKSPNGFAETLTDELVELVILNCDSYRETIRQVVKQKDQFNPEIPIIALQEKATEDAIHDAMRAGAVDLVTLAMKKRLTAVASRELRALRAERALNATIASASSYKQQVRDLMSVSTAAIALAQEGIMVKANAAWVELFKAANADELLGMPLMDSFQTENHAALKGALIATINDKWQAGEKLEARSAIDGNDATTLKLGFAKIEYDGSPCVQVSISPPEKNTQEPTKLVHDALKRDPTTLFFHRAQFIERLKKRLANKPKTGLHVLAYIKPDDFSKLRDSVGILNSEELLAQFAEIIRKRMHPRDVAGRFEGTSLLVLLERGNTSDGVAWGKQIADLVSKTTFDIEDQSLQMTCSIGICGASDIFSGLEEFVAATVSAHGIARKEGGSTASMSEAETENTKQKEFDAIWVKHLKAALMENRFRLAQLPIAGLRSDSIEMYDLLVRMIDEQGNSVLPSEFLPAAERNNMMKNIDRWMVKSAIEFCNSTNADRVFVRLSRQSIVDAGTVPWMQHEFDEHEFDCSRLVIQIPEKEAAKHIKQVKSLVQKLKKVGVGFALEHYGVDQERFQILDMLEPDYIKVDGELMHSLMTDTDMQESVQNIVNAANERDIRTIAERVENANAMAVLFQLGLDFMQGHYVHEPEVVLEDTDSGAYRSLAELQEANNP